MAKNYEDERKERVLNDVWDKPNNLFRVGSGFNLPKYDYVGFGYTGDDITTITFKTGGSGGTTVSTLTLAYTSGDITSITKT